MASNLSEEKVREIVRLWYALGIASQVAKAAGVDPKTAARYKPNDVVPRAKNVQGSDLHQRIREAWHVHRTSRAVASALGISHYTALHYRPDEFRSDSPRVETGYDTWSEETRERWDRFWEQPSNQERLDTVLGWNEP